MAPKRSARDTAASTPSTTQASTTGSGSVPAAKVSKGSASGGQSAQDVVVSIWQRYLDKTPQRTKLIDAFMGFLVVVGVLQFVYCVLVGNYVCIWGRWLSCT